MLVYNPAVVENRVLAHLASLVLGDLVLGVLLAVAALAVGPARLRDVDLWAQKYQSECSCCNSPTRACADSVCAEVSFRCGVATAVPFQHPKTFPSIPQDMPARHASYIADRRTVWQYSFFAVRKHVSLFLSQPILQGSTTLSSLPTHGPSQQTLFHRTHFGLGRSLTILTVFRSSKGGEVVEGRWA